MWLCSLIWWGNGELSSGITMNRAGRGGEREREWRGGRVRISGVGCENDEGRKRVIKG